MTEMPSRRRLLRVLAGGSALAVAGCTGNSSTDPAGNGGDGGNGDSGDDGKTSDDGTPDDGSGDGPDQGLAFSGDGCSRPPESKTSTPTTTTTTQATYTGTSGPDERVDRRPPAEPMLSPSGTWSGPRGDAGNTAARPDGEGVREYDTSWRVAGGGTPAVLDGLMVNVFGRDREKDAFVRRDPRTAGPCSATPLVSYDVNSPPAVGGDRAFVTTFIEVFCVSLTEDRVCWTGPEMDGIQSPPAAHDGSVYVTTGGFKGASPHVRSFAYDGTEQWRYDTGSDSEATPAVADGAVFVTAADGLHAIEADSGDRRFHVAEAGGRWTTAVATDDMVYSVRGSEGPDELLAMDTTDGEIQWRQTVSLGAPPVVAGDELYATVGEKVVAIDPANGDFLRTFEGGGAPAARVGDVVYATERGALTAYDVGGDRLWEYVTEQVTIEDTVGQTIYGIAPVDNAVYVSARDAFHGIGPGQD